MKAPRTRRLLLRAAATLVGLAAALGVLEVALRTTGAVPLQRNPLSGFHDPHPVLGWQGERSYAARFRRPDFDVVIENDESGFRRPADGDVEAGAPCLVFLGDSFTWGWGVPQGRVFTDVLQRRLGSGARVVNRGVNAYGTGQQLLLLESLLDGPPGAVPDVVTVLFCGNDLSDNVDPKHGARPWFRLEDGRLVRENCPVARSFTGGLRNLSRHSLALSFVRYNVNRLAGLARESLAAEEDDTPEPPAEETVEAARTAAEESERRWELERALLGAMADACREAGAELRVVYVSQVTQVATDAPAPDESRARMAALCEELGLPYLDPTPRFHEAWRASDEPGENGEPLFFARDWHWTAAGHALVGELLADAWSWPGRSD